MLFCLITMASFCAYQGVVDIQDAEPCIILTNDANRLEA